MSSENLESTHRSICQVVDVDGKPAEAVATSNLWDMDNACFSQKTEGNSILAFTTGKEYFEDFVSACEGAQSEICILGWQVNWDALMMPGKRLYDVVRKAAEKGVKVYVLPWSHANPVQTYDYQTQIVFEQINDQLKLTGKNKRVFVKRAASMAGKNSMYYSHHQKQVIIDRKIAYIGGMDLCYGRYDDATYCLQADRDGRQVMNRYNPCIPWRQRLSVDAPMLADPDLMSGLSDRTDRGQDGTMPTNLEKTQAKIDKGSWQVPYAEAGTSDTIVNRRSFDSNTPDPTTLDPSCQPRMPWQDVHSRVEGPAVSDLLRNFVLRWNSESGFPSLPMPPLSSEYSKPGNAHIQVLRSAPANMVETEAGLSGNTGKKTNGTEDHIQRAMLRLIEKASSFIYIENQFFVSAFGSQVPPKSPVLSPAAQFINSYYGGDQNRTAKLAAKFDSDKKWLKKDTNDVWRPPENAVCDALIKRIQRAIVDDKQPNFHVYITLPVHPEGLLAKASIAVQVFWTMQSLVHGSHSLLNGIRRGLVAKDNLDKMPPEKRKDAVCAELKNANDLNVDVLDQDDERWKKYVTLLNLRNWEKLGKRYLTEQIYVHSKLMIIDDLYALFGSANINDRSLLGERDSEIAVLVMDGDASRADVNGQGSQRPVRFFAHDLRKRVWRKIWFIALYRGTLP